MSVGSILSRLQGVTGGAGSLRRQLVHGGAANALLIAINRLLVLAVGVLLARGLGAEAYGIYAYAFAWLTLLTVFAQFGMPVLLLREPTCIEHVAVPRIV